MAVHFDIGRATWSDNAQEMLSIVDNNLDLEYYRNGDQAREVVREVFLRIALEDLPVPTDFLFFREFRLRWEADVNKGAFLGVWFLGNVVEITYQRDGQSHLFQQRYGYSNAVNRIVWWIRRYQHRLLHILKPKEGVWWTMRP
jgi:hypothetical protein